LGSLNSVTYWIPLGETSKDNGSVELVPGSHASGLSPFRYTSTKPLDRGTVLSPADIHLVREPTEPGVLIEAQPGDLVVFSQFILHRSTPNRSRSTRWTVQVRHADAFEREFIDAGYPCGDATNVYHTRLYGDFEPR
jgi:ectoine hydroxylase-related dioxygenase (phytanoyl-CoA dioxygenase family)